MPMPVLATKFFVPPPRPQIVARPRLVEQLNDGIRSGRKLTLVSAAAGFGKTTVLSEWIADLRQYEPELRVAWLSLETSDNDPVRFFGYLVAALQSADSSIWPDAPAGQHPVETTLTALINAVAASPHEFLLVLDDFQLIDDPSIRDAVAFVLDHVPPTLHLAIASRSDPLLAIARMRVRGEVTELRAADLRFTPDEASRFLGQAMGLSLSPDDVAALESRTEGWIAGLQLAALSMRERTDTSAFIAAFAGSNRFVIDYLVEEVLEQATPSVRRFLCDTSVLDRLTGPLCDAVSGQAGSNEALEALERANVFVVELDDRRQWFRYHHLFADVLRVRLLAHGADHVAELHRRASQWFEDNDLPEQVGKKKRYYQYTAIDDCTRLRVLKAYPKHDQKTAIMFIDHVLSKLPFKVEKVQTDNGSEFGQSFHWHLLDKGINHVYIKPATPRLNGKVERSHRIDAEEFYRLLEGQVIDDVNLFNEKLQEWEDYYNYDRPHGALAGGTPYERLKQKTQDPLS